MADKPSFPRPQWTIFDSFKLRLEGEPWDMKNPKQKPNVSVHVIGNNPRFRMYINDGNDKHKSCNTFALDPLIFMTVMETLRDVVKNPDPDRVPFEIMGTRIGNTVFPQPVVISKIIVGRGSDGVVYIAFGAKDKPLVKFPFITSFWAKMMSADGEPCDKALASNRIANAWIKQTELLVTQYMVHNAKEPPPPKVDENGKKSYVVEDDTSAWDEDIGF